MSREIDKYSLDTTSLARTCTQVIHVFQLCTKHTAAVVHNHKQFGKLYQVYQCGTVESNISTDTSTRSVQCACIFTKLHFLNVYQYILIKRKYTTYYVNVQIIIYVNFIFIFHTGNIQIYSRYPDIWEFSGSDKISKAAYMYMYA